MGIGVFEGASKSELSMVEVTHAILEQRGDAMDFSDLANQVRNCLGKSNSEVRDLLVQFYTDLNTNGNFISLGDSRWGLRSWYATDSIDEEVNHGVDEEDEDTPCRREREKVNAFINDDGDAVGYNDDNPEDTDPTEEDDDDLFDDDDGEDEETTAYNSGLQEIGTDDPTDGEEGLPGSTEEDLSTIDEDDDDENHGEGEFSDSKKE